MQFLGRQDAICAKCLEHIRATARRKTAYDATSERESGTEGTFGGEIAGGGQGKTPIGGSVGRIAPHEQPHSPFVIVL